MFAEKSLAIDTVEELAHPETLLIVDDEARILAMLKIALEQDGCQIHVAQSAARAFALPAGTPVDVVICDRRMPGMDGIAFLSKLKSLYPATVRVMLSANSESKTIIEAINQGAIFSYFVQPCEAATLRAGLRDAFRFYRESCVPGQPPRHPVAPHKHVRESRALPSPVRRTAVWSSQAQRQASSCLRPSGRNRHGSVRAAQ